MYEIYVKILDLCKDHEDPDLKEIAIIARNRAAQIEWKEKYGIKINPRCVDRNHIHIGRFEGFRFFEKGELPCGNNEWFYVLSFPYGASMFGDDDVDLPELFAEFLQELKSLNPDYSDDPYDRLYWQVGPKTKSVMESFAPILRKYEKRGREELSERKIKTLELTIERLKQSGRNEIGYNTGVGK